MNWQHLHVVGCKHGGYVCVQSSKVLGLPSTGQSGVIEISVGFPSFRGDLREHDSITIITNIIWCVFIIIIQRIKKALLLSYNVSSGNAQVTEEDRREIRCTFIQPINAEYINSVLHSVWYPGSASHDVCG